MRSNLFTLYDLSSILKLEIINYPTLTCAGWKFSACYGSANQFGHFSSSGVLYFSFDLYILAYACLNF